MLESKIVGGVNLYREILCGIDELNECGKTVKICEVFSKLVSTDDAGYFLAGEDCCTSVPGIFAAGDCRVKAVRQLTTAVGDGAVAALAACEWAEMA